MADVGDQDDFESKIDLVLDQQKKILDALAAPRKKDFWDKLGPASTLTALLSCVLLVALHLSDTHQRKVLQQNELSQRDSAEVRARAVEEFKAAVTFAHTLEGKSDSQQARAIRVLAKDLPRTAAIVTLIHPTAGTVVGANSVRESGGLSPRDSALFNNLAVEFGTGSPWPSADFDSDSQTKGRSGPAQLLDPTTRVRYADIPLPQTIDGTPSPRRNDKEDSRNRQKRQLCQLWEDPHGTIVCHGECAGEFCGVVGSAS